MIYFDKFYNCSLIIDIIVAYDFRRRTNMKTAVVYYSLNGNTEMVAKEIAKIASADLIKLEPEEAYPTSGFKKFFWGGKSAVMGEKPNLKPYVFNASEYDKVVFGFPIWAGSVTPPIRSFVLDNKEVTSKKISIFACQSGNGAEKAFAKFKKEFGVSEFVSELILIDPKDKPSDDNQKKINDFCSKL